MGRFSSNPDLFWYFSGQSQTVFGFYSSLMIAAEKLLPLGALAGAKTKRFVAGRKEWLPRLQASIGSGDRNIWFHCASLGEYEQAVPVIRECRRIFPQHRILLTFFSPSGMEVKKNSSLADVTSYLPLDTKKNAGKFLDLVKPEVAIFIKYEFWPNFLRELQRREIPTVLVSGVFRENQLFFKPYGRWLLKALQAFDHFFVQDQQSEKLLNREGFNNVTRSGDTRFDRVADQLLQDNQLHFIQGFKRESTCIVAGSTWSEDEQILLPFINTGAESVKFIIAPHVIDGERMEKLMERIQVPAIRYSKKEGKSLEQYNVLILDTIGMLSRAYHYGEIAYVGGAAGKTGLHNILEPATFGLPVITGEHIEKFPEASALMEAGGLVTVKNSQAFQVIAKKLLDDPDYRKQMGQNSLKFIQANTGASALISDYLKSLIQ